MPFISILSVSSSGEINTSKLSYVEAGRVSTSSSGDIPVIVVSENVAPELAVYVVRSNPLSIAGIAVSDFRGWRALDDAGAGALFTPNETIIIGRDSRVVVRIPFPGYEAAFGRVGNVGIALVSHLKEGTFEPRGFESSSLIAFDARRGTIIYESPILPAGRGYSQLHVNRDGTWAMVTQQGEDPATIETDSIWLINLVDHVATMLDVNDGGLRRHSGDDRYMAVAQPGFGTLQYYDLAVPEKPVLLWEYHYDGLFSSMDVNGTGSLVAVSVSNGVMGRPEERTLLLDRSGSVVAEAPKNADNNYGLMFAGKFLFVGYQTMERPAYVSYQSTDRVDLYQLDEVD